MRATEKIISNQSLTDYFRQRLYESTDDMSPKPDEETLAYLSVMLTRLAQTRELFGYSEGRIGLQPLALMYRDALQAPNHKVKCLTYRQIGDHALFLGAVFPEPYKRIGIHKDYFIGMGGGAYEFLATQALDFQSTYEYLSQNFTQLLKSVAQACHKTECFDADDILALYQHWLNTSDPEVRRQLQSLGITLSEDPRIN